MTERRSAPVPSGAGTASPFDHFDTMDELLAGALELLILGMGTVFVFLIVLIGATHAMSAVVRRIAPEVEPPRPRSRPVATPDVDPRVRKVIQVAVLEYKKRRR